MNLILVRKNVLQLSIITLLFSYSSFCLAADYTYPGNASAPLSMNFANSLEVTSGTFEATDGTGYTVNISNSATSVSPLFQIENGATVSYAGSNSSATTILGVNSDGDLDRPETFTANIYGTLDKGTGAAALSITNDGTGADYGILNLTGNVIGDFTLYYTLVTNPDDDQQYYIYTDLNINGLTASIDGNLSSGNNLNLGPSPGAAVNFSTQGSISMQVITLDNGTFTINNEVTAVQSFAMDAGTTLIMNGTGSFNDGGNGSFTATNATVQFNMSSINELGLISMATFPSITGTLSIVRANDFVAAGQYPLLQGTVVTSIPSATFSFQDTNYMTGDLALSTDQKQVYLNVTRDGYDQQALTPAAKSIGAALETLGASGDVTQGQFQILNALEQTTTPQELTDALLSLIPPAYIKLQTIAEMNYILGLVETRVAKSREGYSSGDYDLAHDHGIWIRPFTYSATQQPMGTFSDQEQQTNTLSGYKSTNSGISFGIDHCVNPMITLGLAGTVSDTKITDTATSSISTAKNYQAMLYGSFSSRSDSYLDWIIAAGVNNYKHNRGLNFTSVDSSISSQNSGHNFAAKALYSQNIIFAEYLQITPQVFGQYTYLQQSPYTETSSSTLSIIVTTPNSSLFRFGAGSKVAAPLVFGTTTVVPSVYAMFSVDAKGGTQQVNSAFVDGGTIINSQTSAGKVMYQLGASLSCALGDSLDLEANYGLEKRRSYAAQSAYLNLRYTF